jgi:bacteriocin-like protein
MKRTTEKKQIQTKQDTRTLDATELAQVQGGNGNVMKKRHEMSM